MPRAATMLALLLLLAASLQGCADQRSTARTSPSHSSATPAGGPDRSRALAFARAVNLTAADLPGFSSARRSGAKPQRRAEGELFRCAGARRAAGTSRSSDLATATSPSFEFKHGILDLGVSSEVGISRSSALASAELEALHSHRVRGCFTRYLDSVLSAGTPRGTNVGPVSIEAGNPPAPGTSGTFGWRVRATFGLDGVKVPVYLDLLGFVYGPARVTLVSSGALRPFPALVQQRLFALLLTRAQAHGI